MLKDELDKDPAKIYLQVEHTEDTEDEIDLLNVVNAMGKRKKLYAYFMIMSVCIGICVGLLITGVQYLAGKNSYANAVVSFHYQGIEDGLDPNGAAFDINKIKSPAVIDAALTSLGITDMSTEDIRQNIVIEGVIPEDAIERITVINQMAEKDATSYEKILDVNYFPSQYVVYLYRDRHLSASETTEVLNAILESYREYFLDTYANTEVLTVTSNLINYEEYDYLEAIDMLQSQIDIMLSYVSERRDQAPDFRSSTTGLAFGDIETSLRAVEDIELSSLASYVENLTLTKDKERMQEYFDYKIRKYNMQLSELQTQLATVENTINTYVKDPVVIVSSQESTQEITQKNEYYDKLIEQKLSLNKQIASVNTKLNETYSMLNRMNGVTSKNTQEQFDYADSLLQKVGTTISEWVTLTEDTTEEYYSTTLFSNAYKIAVPAKYHALGGIVGLVKMPMVCVAVSVFIVIASWCVDGLRIELIAMRKRNKNKSM